MPRRHKPNKPGNKPANKPARTPSNRPITTNSSTSHIPANESSSTLAPANHPPILVDELEVEFTYENLPETIIAAPKQISEYITNNDLVSVPFIFHADVRVISIQIIYDRSKPNTFAASLCLNKGVSPQLLNEIPTQSFQNTLIRRIARCAQMFEIDQTLGINLQTNFAKSKFPFAFKWQMISNREIVATSETIRCIDNRKSQFEDFLHSMNRWIVQVHRELNNCEIENQKASSVVLSLHNRHNLSIKFNFDRPISSPIEQCFYRMSVGLSYAFENVRRIRMTVDPNPLLQMLGQHLK